jgi:hypothetical protein
VRLSGGAVIEDWLGRTPTDRHHLVYNALFSIVEGTWSVAYQHWDDYVRKGIALQISTEEVLVWRQYIEYPDRFRVLYIGKIDH